MNSDILAVDGSALRRFRWSATLLRARRVAPRSSYWIISSTEAGSLTGEPVRSPALEWELTGSLICRYESKPGPTKLSAANIVAVDCPSGESAGRAANERAQRIAVSWCNDATKNRPGNTADDQSSCAVRLPTIYSILPTIDPVVCAVAATPIRRPVLLVCVVAALPGWVVME
jgi:hypothetical protein